MADTMKRFGKGIVPWFNRKLDPLVQILSRGAEPKQLALSGALGITFGIFPICGVTVFLCGMAIAVLRSSCHAPTVMLANFIATPIELSLIILFLRFGELITGGPHFPLTSDALKKVLTGQASREIVRSIFNALLGWLVAAPFIFGILYILFLPCFKVLVRKFSVAPTSPKLPVHSNAEARVKTEMGLKKEVREMLPIIVFKESFSVNDTQCSVCLGDYQAEEKLQQIPSCGHTFHVECIDNWLSTRATCPLCRQSLVSPSSAKDEAESSTTELVLVVQQIDNNRATSEDNLNDDDAGGSPNRNSSQQRHDDDCCSVDQRILNPWH
ncbi:OLC1v1018526C1 [Oldenlandia corymbosa var. corymbosa]|uniref:RING-type E3 ubiquitin transferase n=1 Tax=Oldenlandia corymbosa var. corymbosa TaxID=529605 RepID=A0AAV1EBX5_OLDCO|nr:OLC1v1018526C1 [Oldenlandia corymbosa var. corymbosa]